MRRRETGKEKESGRTKEGGEEECEGAQEKERHRQSTDPPPSSPGSGAGQGVAPLVSLQRKIWVAVKLDRTERLKG